MLAAKRLPEILRSVLSDGVEGAVIMTSEGSVLASEFLYINASSFSNNAAATTNLTATAASAAAASSTSMAGSCGNPLVNETSIAAIAATIWNDCSLG